jgi:hypothetical protein
MVCGSKISGSAEPLPHFFLSVGGRVAGPTLRAVDEETVHLVILAVQQDRSTVSAQIVNGVRAGDQSGVHLLHSRCPWPPLLSMFVVDFAWCLSSNARRIRAHEEGPAPAKAERGHVQVGVF